jgi:AcrR family transcriptional regulator
MTHPLSTVHTPAVTEEAPWFELPVSRWSDGPVTAHLQARARKTRRQILVGAARRLSEHGYHGAVLSRIVRDCGCTKGAVYFHFPSKAALGWAVIEELQASWDDITVRIAARDLDALQTLLLLYDAQVARLTYDPIVRGGLRVLREEPGMQADRHRWVEGWRAETERLLARARDHGLLRADADAPAISGTLLATVIGHHQLAETQPGGPNTWDRMTSTWLGLLPAIADDGWVRDWSASDWARRPAPTVEQYDNARRPDTTPWVDGALPALEQGGDAVHAGADHRAVPVPRQR